MTQAEGCAVRPALGRQSLYRSLLCRTAAVSLPCPRAERIHALDDGDGLRLTRLESTPGGHGGGRGRFYCSVLCIGLSVSEART